MAERVELKPVTVTASTPVTAPVTFPLSFQPGVVRELFVLIPPGPNGLMGFRIGHSGQVIIPMGADEWFITDDERISLPLEGFPTNDAWFIEAYNEGLHDHTIYTRWMIDEIPDPPQPGLTPIPIE